MRLSSVFAVVVGLCVAPVARANDAVVPKLAFSSSGRVVSNVKVVPVFWGPNVFPEATQRLGPFYKSMVTSSFFDFLDEYNTVRLGGSQQHIGAGTSVDPIVIMPATTVSPLDTTDIEGELEAHIMAGTLPPPDANTLYMVHFPPGTPLVMADVSDCSAAPGGRRFCGYHSSGTSQGQHYLYAALPDLSQGNCLTACARSSLSSAFDMLTVVASHELIEAVTDPGPFVTWYDFASPDALSDHGEIADICESLAGGSDTATIGKDSDVWWVQREWSNHFGGCLVSKQDAFDVTITTDPLTLTAGGTVSVTGTLGAPAAQPDQDVTVSAVGLPRGVSAAVSPQPVKPGGTFTLTLSADSAASPISRLFVLTFAGPRATMVKRLSLVVQRDDFALSIPPDEVQLAAGQSARLTVSSVNHGTPKQLTLSVPDLPAGVAASFNPATIDADGTSTLTLTADRRASSFEGTVSVTGVSGAVQKGVPLTLGVQPSVCSAAGGGVSWLALLVGLGALRRTRRIRRS